MSAEGASWRLSAACADLVDASLEGEQLRQEFADQVDPLFFDDLRRQGTALALCRRRCTVAEECLAEALALEVALGTTFPGIYGGTTADERRRWRHGQQRRKAEAAITRRLEALEEVSA